MSIFSDDDLEEDILLQADDCPSPSPGQNADVPSTAPTLPPADLAITGPSDGSKGKPCKDVHTNQEPYVPIPLNIRETRHLSNPSSRLD